MSDIDLPEVVPVVVAADVLQRTVGEIVSMAKRGDVTVVPLPGKVQDDFGTWHIASHGVPRAAVENLRALVVGPSPARVAQDAATRRRKETDAEVAPSLSGDGLPPAA